MSEEWAKSRKEQDRKSYRTRQKNKRDIEKWDQTDSPETPDRVETSKIPGLTSEVGGLKVQCYLLSCT